MPDPIVSVGNLVAAALAAGAAEAGKAAFDQTARDAYEALKPAAARVLGPVATLEKEPESDDLAADIAEEVERQSAKEQDKLKRLAEALKGALAATDPAGIQRIAAVRKNRQETRNTWKDIDEARRTLMLTRISVGFMAAGVLALLFLPQGKDIVQELVDGANKYIDARGYSPDEGGYFSWSKLLVWLHWIFFFAACVLSGLSAWYWPRLLFWIDPKASGNRTKSYFKWITILLGLSPLLAGVGALLLLEPAVEEGRQWWRIGVGAGLFGFVAWHLGKYMSRRDFNVPQPAEVGRSKWLSAIRRRTGIKPEDSLRRIDDVIFALTLIGGPFLLFLFSIPGCRTYLAWFFGSAALSFAAVGLIISAISMVAWLVGPLRLPVLPLLALLFFCPAGTFWQGRVLNRGNLV